MNHLNLPKHRPVVICRFAMPLFALLLVVTYASGYANKYRAKGAKSKYIDSMMAFGPLASISVIYHDGERAFDDSLSHISAERFEEVIRSHAEKMKVRSVFKTEEQALSRRVRREIAFLFEIAQKQGFLEHTSGVPVLDSISQSVGMRYVLLAANSGFIRTKAHYRKESGKPILPGDPPTVRDFLIPLYIPIPIPEASYMQVMILDMEAHKTYYFADFTGLPGIHATFESNPLNREALDKQLMTLFNYFFWLLPG